MSMAVFALVASITPGPVNIVALSAGLRFGLALGLRHVLGATAGFVLLLVLTGFGLHGVLLRWPWLTDLIRWAGMVFLLYLAWKLARDDGHLGPSRTVRRPSVLHGAVMQWLNPKAWLAAIAGMGAFVADGEALLIWQFALIYFVICYLSVGGWVWLGTRLASRLGFPARVRLFNRVMAVLLVGCALSLLYL